MSHSHLFQRDVLLKVTPVPNFPLAPLLPLPSSVAQVCVWWRADIAPATLLASLSSLLDDWHLCIRSSPAVISSPGLSDYSFSVGAAPHRAGSTGGRSKGPRCLTVEGLSPAEGLFIKQGC